MKDKGKLLFEERVPKPLPGTNFQGLRGVLAFRYFLVAIVVAVFFYLMYLMQSMPSNTPIMSVLTLAMVLLIVLDSQIFARFELSARPIQIHEKGISMPTTSIQRTFLKRGFIPWEEVKTMFSLNFGSKPEECGVEDPKDAIVVISATGVTYGSWFKNPKEIEKILDIASRHWPGFANENERVGRLLERNGSISKGYASMDPMTLVIPVAILDGLLLAVLGIAILSEVDTLYLVVVVLFIVLIDLVVGLALNKVSKARTGLLGSEPV